MKNFLISIIASIMIIVSLFGCTDLSQGDVELVVFAASSMTETLSEIGDIYMGDNPDVKLTFNFDSSGTLKTQIEEGAQCDIFVSASSTQMNELDVVLDDSRVDLLENKIALVVPIGNSKDIKSFDDLLTAVEADDFLMAIGNADVPVGEYTLRIFDYYDLDISKLNDDGCLTYGSNAKEVTTQVTEGMVDCGIVYQTDAFSADLKVVDTATKDMCGQVIYPASVLETSNNIDASQDFLNFLSNDEATSIFKKVGFSPLT